MYMYFIIRKLYYQFFLEMYADLKNCNYWKNRYVKMNINRHVPMELEIDDKKVFLKK